MAEPKSHESKEAATEAFGELIKYTGAGFTGGLILGVLLDYLGFQRSAIGQWLVRTIAGEGESIFEGIYALRHHIRGFTATVAEAYGWGKFFGMIVP